MNNRKTHKFLIYFFITTIFFFFIAFIINSFKAIYKNNQNLSYVKNHYKNILVNYTILKRLSFHVIKIKFLLTNNIYSNSVVCGKNNWLFYCNNNDGDLISDYKALNYPTKEEINKQIKVLTKNYNYLKKKNISFIVFIAPNKGRIYSKYLPDTIQIQNKMTTDYVVEQLIASNLSFSIIYPKDELIALSNKYELYYPHDTHWNQLGAYIGYKVLLKEAFNIDSSSLDSLKIYEKTVDSKGDLVSMVKLDKYYSNIIDYQIKEFDDVESKNPESYINNNPLINKSVLVIRDSFADNLNKYLKKAFARVLLVKREEYTLEIFENFKPDIVIFESVGRFFYQEQHRDFFLGNNNKN